VCAMDESQNKEADRSFHQKGANTILYLNKSRVHRDFGYLREDMFDVSAEAILDLKSIEDGPVN